jgi:hypothetical protein
MNIYMAITHLCHIMIQQGDPINHRNEVQEQVKILKIRLEEEIIEIVYIVFVVKNVDG